MSATEVSIYETDGLFIKRTVFHEAGIKTDQHAHPSDHFSLVAVGGARVTVDNAMVGEVWAPKGIVIRAGKVHVFEILAPGTIIDCIHNLDRMKV